MKFLIVLVVAFGLAYCDTKCTTSEHPNLEDDIKDITKLIPVSKIKAIAVKYIANDEEVQKVLAYMKGEEFAAIVKKVNSEKLVIEFYNFLCSNGVPIYDDIKTVNDLLGLPQVNPPKDVRSSPGTRTFRKFLDEVEALLPLDQMKKVFDQKVSTSKIFKAFYDKISSAEFRAMVDEIWALQSVQNAKKGLDALGANTDLLVKIVKQLLGWWQS